MISKLLFHCLAISLFIFTPRANALVNLKTGHFSQKVIDFRAQASGFQFEFWRVYNSQSKQSGIFGQSWCSVIEKRIVSRKNGFDIYLCEDQKISFDKKLTKNQWISRRGNFRLIRSSKGFRVTSNDQRIEDFNLKGQLVAVGRGSLLKAFIKRTSRSISIVLSRKKKVVLSLQRKLVRKVEMGNSKTFYYSYAANQLVTSGNMWGNRYTYKYSGQKLLEIKYPGAYGLSIAYDGQGRVRSTRDTKGCRENYSHKLTKAQSHSEILSQVIRSCRGKVVYKNAYVQKLNRKKRLVGLRNKASKRSVVWGSKGEKVIREENAGTRKSYGYDNVGRIDELLVEKPQGKYRAKLTYGPGIKPITIRYQGDRQLASRKVELKYNSQGVLSQLRGIDSKIYHLKYRRGQLRSIAASHGRLTYHYRSRGGELQQVRLQQNKKSYKFSLESKKKSLRSAQEVARFLSEVYDSLGPIYQDSSILHGDI